MEIGEEITYNWHEEGGAIIRRTEKGYELYEVPQYGGEERYYDTFNTLDEAKAIADTWT